MQLSGAGHINPHCLFSALNQRRITRILKEDVFPWVANIEFALNLSVQIIVGILGLPIPPRHPQRVFHRPVGNDAGGST